MLAGTISDVLDLDADEVPHAKVARSTFDDKVNMVPVNSAANDNTTTNAVASEIGQSVNGLIGSIVEINDAEAGVVVNIENEDNSNAVVNVVDDSFADDDKENSVGDNVGSIALSQSVCKNEKNVERHSIKLNNCKYFTIKFGNLSK